MFSVQEGKKYVVLIQNSNGFPSTKEIICKSEITNFQIPQMEIETTEGEYYPLCDVYKTKEAAINSYIRDLKSTIRIYKRSIEEKEKEIASDKKHLIESQLRLKEILK